jgi:hypothetical protein
MKQLDEIRALTDLFIQVHNQNVEDAYRGADGAYLRNLLLIRKDDPAITIILKTLFFYLVAGRANAVAPVPTLWNVKAEKYRPQLVIMLRPESRKRLAYGRYQNNTELHIPHYDENQKTPHIPAYKIGSYTCKYTLKDGSYILVNADSEASAQATVSAMAQYTKESKRPLGTIEENCSHTKRKGAKLSLAGVMMVPHRAAFFAGGRDCKIPKFVVQLSGTPRDSN